MPGDFNRGPTSSLGGPALQCRTLVTVPEPTVQPPSRPSSIATGVSAGNSTSKLITSPGMHMSTSSGRTTAPLTRLLEQLRSIRADLRFREDGIHTVLTIERQKAK